MEACNGRSEWRSGPLTLLRCGRTDVVDDAWVSRIPVIVPCFNGKSIQIHEELVVNGLSAISIKHHNGNCETETDVLTVENEEESKANKSSTHEPSDSGLRKLSVIDLPTCLREKMKRRNSFWNMHRPELSKLTWPQNSMSPAMLQDFFHHHLRTHGTFCEPLHVETNRALASNEDSRDIGTLRDIVTPTLLPPDEKALNIMEKSLSVQLNDEDLDPGIMVHKSRAEFCVTIGECVQKPLLRRAISHQVPQTREQRDGHVLATPKEAIAASKTFPGESKHPVSVEKSSQ